ncbi:protein phosphatase 2C family protein [Artemisia annua]|uniref:Protein phosphatase n=1 Tax=Artemisia annua TaxID=35608 RepID=A0A2U1NEM8_ARTAN|nr:protein phosphatase 2C family protein [Artemisia annua]
MDAEKKSNRPGFDFQMAYGILCEKASTFLFRKGFKEEYIIRQISQNGLGSCYLPHPDKEDTCGKDTHFISSDEQATRVADGVGGSADPGIDVDKYDEPKGFVDPARILDKPYINTKAKGSSIACIIMLTNQLYNQLKDLFLARVRFSNINLLRNRKGKLTGSAEVGFYKQVERMRTQKIVTKELRVCGHFENSQGISKEDEEMSKSRSA